MPSSTSSPPTTPSTPTTAIGARSIPPPPRARRAARDLRHHPDRRPRPATATSRPARSAATASREVARFVEKPDRRAGRGDARAGRLLLELRHVHARASRPSSRSARRWRRRPSPPRGTRSKGEDRPRLHPPRRRRASPRRPTSRSTTRSSRRPSSPRWCRSPSPGPTSAAGTRCGRSRPRTPRTTSSRGAVTLTNTTQLAGRLEKAHVAVDGLDDVAVIASEDAIYVGKLSRGAARRRRWSRRCKAEAGDARPHRNPPHRLSALGRLFLDPQRRALPGEAAVRQAGQAAAACKSTTTAPSTGSWSAAPPR